MTDNRRVTLTRAARFLTPGLRCHIRYATVVASTLTTVDVELDGTILEGVPVLNDAALAVGSTAVLIIQDTDAGRDVLALGRFAPSSPPDAYHQPFLPVLQAATTNPALGTGAHTEGFWSALNGWIDAAWVIEFGSSGVDPGSGMYLVRTPFVAAAPIGAPVGSVTLIGDDPNDPDDRRQWDVVVASHAAPLFAVRATGDTTSPAVTHAVPWTWDEDHQLLGTMRYRTGDTIPDTVPFLEHVAHGVESSDNTSHAIPLPNGPGDKFVIVMRSGLSITTAITAPGGWSRVAGSDTVVQVSVFVKAAADADSTVTITTANSTRLGWVTGFIRGADLGAVAAAATGQVSNSDPPSVTGAFTTNYLAMAFTSRLANGSPQVDTYPAEMPFHNMEIGAKGTNRMETGMAVGAYFNTGAVDPSAFVWDTAPANTVNQTVIFPTINHP